LEHILRQDVRFLNAADEKGMTALHWACTVGCEETVRFLLSQGDIRTDVLDRARLGSSCVCQLAVAT
jgi:ankyrin repeat protein